MASMLNKIIQKALLITGLSAISSPLIAYDAELNALLFESSELMQSGQVAEALLLLKEKESVYGESREYMNNLAVAYLGNSNPDLALSILRQLVDNDPLYSIITHNLLEMELQITDAREDKIKPVLFIQTVESFFNDELSSINTPKTPTEPKVVQPIENTPAPLSQITSTSSEQAPANTDSIVLAGTFVDRWANAWSSKDYNTYIAQYSRRFTGSNGENYTEWARVRKTRLNKPGAISIQTSNLQIENIGNYQLRITFDQRYNSSNYSDRVLKELILVQENTDWKILRETTLTEY